MEETRAAIATLDRRSLDRLRAFARRRTRNSPFLDADDLLSEAITVTLEGRRNWNREAVDMTGHLIGVMRSLAHHSEAERGDALFMAETVEETYAIAAPPEDLERQLVVAEELAAVRTHVTRDDEVRAVIERMEVGMTGAEIKTDLTISQRQLETIMRRIRRWANRMEPMGSAAEVAARDLPPKQREVWTKVAGYLEANPGSNAKAACTDLGLSYSNFYLAKKKLHGTSAAPATALAVAPALSYETKPVASKAGILMTVIELIEPFDETSRTRLIASVSAYFGIPTSAKESA